MFWNLITLKSEFEDSNLSPKVQFVGMWQIHKLHFNKILEENHDPRKWEIPWNHKDKSTFKRVRIWK
jgi:hypothetical protein